MAPYRGRGGQRGGTWDGQRGGGKLARSGIRTKAGYRKFDSQRVKDVDASSIEDEEDRTSAIPDKNLVDPSSEEEEPAPAAQSYNTLLQSFQPLVENGGRPSKRRKVQREEESESATLDGSKNEIESVEVEEPYDGVEAGEDADSSVGSADVESLESNHPSDGDEDGDGDASDAFEVHFASPDDNDLRRALQAVQSKLWQTEKQSFKQGALSLSIPRCAESPRNTRTKPKTINDLQIKPRLLRSAKKHISSLDDIQQVIAPYVSSYNDLLLGNRNPQNASSLRDLICLHAINHILKGRDKVLKNNARLANTEDLDARDQGFTRPKVLILLETRQMCARYAEAIVKLSDPEQQENKKRFQASFSGPVDNSESAMPDDFRELFDGNNDNNFIIGVKFTRKAIKFHSALYTSDIIFASPLGLRRIVENEDVRKRDHDFLSSIEIAIVDQADAMFMQNWENVELVFAHLNLQLKEAHGCDFNRVRSWYLDGNAKDLRQTVIFSAYITPEMNRLFNTSMLNIAGKAKLTPTYSGAITSINSTGFGIKQTFSRFESASPAADPDARFKYFTTAVLPSLLRLPRSAEGGQGILVFVPSYYDFLRLRNYFATSTLTQNVGFGAIYEYSDISSQRRARSHFLSGRHSVLLYTQRAHHFFRLKIRGVRRLVCYGLPDNPLFYEEMAGGYLGTSIGEGKLSAEAPGARAMFSKWDGLRLERVVGSARMKAMLGGVGDTFDFV